MNVPKKTASDRTRAPKGASVQRGRKASRGASDPGGAVLREAPLGDLARHAALVVLCRQAKLWPDVDLSVLDRTIEVLGERLSAVDRAFIHAIYDTVVRRWTTLEYLVQRELVQPMGKIEPRLRGVLLAGAAQVVFLDRVPAHSAINHGVEWAKRIIRPGAGAIANAVLRKVAERVPTDRAGSKRERFTGAADELALEDGGALPILGGALPEDPVLRLSIGTSCPTALLDQWLRTRGLSEVRSLAMHGLARAPIVLNTRHATGPLPEGLVAHRTPGHHVLAGGTSRLEAVLGSRSDLWVQDAGSSAAVESLEGLVPQPRVIADVCAGQGTKTRQLAALFPEAEVIATDADEARVATLRRVFGGHARVRVVGLRELRETHAGGIDLVVLDVPCSNTGVIGRRPEARHRFDESHMRSLTSVQKQIIADAIPLVRESPRGRILYSTCSIEPEENQQQSAWASLWHHARISRERSGVPSGGAGDPAETYQDGSYSVLLGW